MKSLILASGFGVRLHPVTTSKPKGLFEYRGKPLIGYIVEKIPQTVEIYVNTNRKFEPHFRIWQKTIKRKVVLCIENVFSEEQSLGAVGSLDRWAREIDDDLLVIAGDNYFDFVLSEFTLAFDNLAAVG